MMINDALKTVLRIDNEACAHPREEGGPGEHGAALGGPGLQVPGVSALPDHQDELVTPEIQGVIFLRELLKHQRTYSTATDRRSCKYVILCLAIEA